MENWRFIEENPDYMISDHGRVLSFKGKSKLILCTKIIGTGYETVSLLNKGICTDYHVHRLIAKAFIPNPKHLPQINHLDGNTMNNHVSNLEWCDAYTNTMHAIRTGLRPTGTGSRKTPCAVTDAKGIILRAYPSMKEMGREERLKPSHQHWLILQLKHPDRVWLHNLRARQHRGNDFMKVPFANSSALSKLPVFLNSSAITDTAVPPIHAPFTPVHHSVTKQYYRQLSAEEAAAFGFTSPTIRKQERRISQ
ncbi:HNH endonuclease domain protein [Bacteroides xylanisolvens SD CC 2a]|jgi:endonuclease|uniref:HNH homing endonuclease n=1 Tax=Bacteroides xylanisolvens SD CC 1b TaxID=702447 RepID=D4VFH9_9BACE|nr:MULTISPECIES: HNH endonuclease [Bacteroides]EEO51665.1 HNH endonuclease domain protein [Bacteroides sp. D1]EFF58208.1 HNH endonuclease domain protein [Bacteroides xylanisolvens SD CC 2a]EFG15386.1 HNH endonuclease domain protein [Bacteroides xylanisolvens SD CC 1b]CDM00334.1 HNH homing endonuclease [Bacteroides xylanisolvens SD CC 2a]CDM02817.1 HNH homing endonuclease [Bacteroides xylanisolvens SD CC 1b]